MNPSRLERLLTVLETASGHCDRLSTLLKRERAAIGSADTAALARIAEQKDAAREALAEIEGERVALTGPDAPLSQIARSAPDRLRKRLTAAGETLARRLSEIDRANRRNAALLAAARDLFGAAASLLEGRSEPHQVYGPTGAVRPASELASQSGTLSKTV